MPTVVTISPITQTVVTDTMVANGVVVDETTTVAVVTESIDVVTEGSQAAPVSVALNAADYGFVSGATAATLKAALIAALAALPVAGGELFIPAGTFDLGSLAAAPALAIARSNVTISGAGIGQTILSYDSDNGAGLGPGSCFLLGDNVSVYQDITIRDLTLSDVQTAITPTGGHQPAAIDALLINNIGIQRVECINSKGNSAINLTGARQAGAPANFDAWITDCIIRGDSAGGWIEGDGINVGAYQRVHIDRNRIEGVERHAIEGGLIWYFSIDDNYFDMKSRGLNVIGTGSFTHGSISRNTIKDIKDNPSVGFYSVLQDVITDVVGDITIADNTQVMTSGGNQSRFVWWQPIGGLAISVGPVRIHDNKMMVNTAAIQIDSNPVRFEIHDNVIDCAGNRVRMIYSDGNPALAAGEYLDVHDNRLTNESSGPSAYVLRELTTVTNWKSVRVRCYDNALSDPTGGQADGSWIADLVNLGSIANGAVSAVRTVTYPGALTGDPVEMYAQAPLGGVDPRGVVSAADTISWYVSNRSGGAINQGSVNYWMRIQRR